MYIFLNDLESLAYIYSDLPLRTGCADSLLCIVTRLLISLLLHHKWEGRGWYIRVFSTRILVIFRDININKHWSMFFFFL